jgi:hypothetical protein
MAAVISGSYSPVHGIPMAVVSAVALYPRLAQVEAGASSGRQIGAGLLRAGEARRFRAFLLIASPR